MRLRIVIGLVDVEVTNRSIILTASPAKGSLREEEALRIIREIANLCDRNHHPCEKYFLNTPSGDRLNSVEVYIYPRR